MLLSANEKRRYMRGMDLEPHEGRATGEAGLVQLPPEVLVAVDVVLSKLARALHYRHTGKIVPNEGHVSIVYFPPQEMNRRVDLDLLPLFEKVDRMRRNGADLSAQFSCRFQVTEDGELGAYLCQIRTSITACILVSLHEEIEDPG
jgi:hypothetical protein